MTRAQVIWLMVTLVDPWPMEIQSSPVLITLLDTFTVLDLLIWMPLVFGLSSGGSDGEAV